MDKLQYAILRFAKYKGPEIGRIEAHDERTKEKYASNPDVDTSRSKLNFHLVKPHRSYRAEAEKQISGAGCRARKDSVRVVETLITASPEFFQGRKPREVKEFFEYALAFIQSKQSPKTIISAVVHMDEKTPHMHLCFVPLTGDKRLSAKDIYFVKSPRLWYIQRRRKISDQEGSAVTFQELMNDYLTQLDCTARELSATSGISAPVISRYRTGSHSPDMDQCRKLAAGIAALARERGLEEITQTAVETAFRDALISQGAFDKARFCRNLNELLEAFSIGNMELARYLSYDASYLSRIRSGQRTPRDAAAFALSVGRFVVRRCQSTGQRERLEALIGASPPADAGNEEYARSVAQYLCAGSSPESAGNMDRFLQRIDEFDLEEYIRVIHFDEMKAPTSPIQLPTARFYTGLPELMDAQLDFLKATVLSRSASPVTMYSDLPMTEMSKDSQFPKKWMFGMAMMLKKGLRLNMIHNVDRPFHEMMFGLESFIPMYMTGQISPYYLSGMQTSAFRHMLWVSGAAALQGDCICGHIGDGRMYLTNRKSDVAHYQKRAGQLLKRACPLMEIYGSDRIAAFDRFLQADSVEIGQRRSLLSSLPIYALSDGLAKRILFRCGISEQAAILDYVHAERQRIERILEHSTVSDVLPAISEEEFSRYPMGLSLAGMFYPGNIRLTYPEYREYLNQCDAFAAAHPGYTCRRDKDAPFRNIQITILEGSRVIVTKNKSPAIHFVIRHPKMCAAIENMVLPVIEPLTEERCAKP